MTTGQVQPIRLVGDPILHRPCAPVERFDDELATLVESMFASMYAAEGVGLAANQIGVGLRVFVYDCPDENQQQWKGLMINPVLETPGRSERRLDDSAEGCLSVPGQHASLARSDRAVASGYDTDGRRIVVEGTGLLARCLQHESDHLDGRLYLDRLPARARKRILRAYEEEHAVS
ncbi:MAG: peptide deformylase [Actinoallomurus sp.]